jgi:hypothetical protein
VGAAGSAGEGRGEEGGCEVAELPEVTARAIIFDWFAVPMSAAVGVAVTRWGENNLAHVLALPVFVLLWWMFVLSARRPEAPPGDHQTRNRITNWHALGIVACLFLMVFEAGVAGMAESRVANAAVWAAFVACTYVPYVLLSALADGCLPERQRGEANGTSVIDNR